MGLVGAIFSADLEMTVWSRALTIGWHGVSIVKQVSLSGEFGILRAAASVTSLSSTARLKRSKDPGVTEPNISIGPNLGLPGKVEFHA